MLQEELGAKSLAAHFQTHATPQQKIPPHDSPCPPLLRLTLQDRDMSLCSSLPTSLTQALGRKDSNQHKNALHIHRSCSINT